MTQLTYEDDATPHEKEVLDKIAIAANDLLQKRKELIELVEKETQDWSRHDEPNRFRGNIEIPVLNIETWGSWDADTKVTPDSIWNASDQYC